MLISPFSIPDWPWGGATATLRHYSSVDWTDENGVYRLSGQPGSADDFFQFFTATVTGRSLVFPDGLDLPPTTTARDRENVSVTGVLFDELGHERRNLYEGWEFPHDLDPLTFANLTLYNNGPRRRLTTAHYWSAQQTLAAIADAMSGIVVPEVFVAQGLATMVDGIAVVGEDLVTGVSRILPSSMSENVTGSLYVPTNEISPGTSFTIRSSNGADNGPVFWALFEP